MTRGDYLAGLPAGSDIRVEAKTILEYLQTLDYYDWIELLRDFALAPERVAHIFPIERGGDLVSSSSVFIDLLSDHGKEPISRAATALLSRLDVEEEVARTVITLIALLRLRLDASILDRFVTSPDLDPATRSAAAALIAAKRHDPRPGYWEQLPFDRCPELLATAVSAISASDPVRAAQLLRARPDAPAPVSTFEYPLRKLFRRLPETTAQTAADVLALLPAWLEQTAGRLLDEPEFRTRFRVEGESNVVPFAAKDTPAVLAGYTEKKSHGIAWFPENGDFPALAQASEWCQFVANVAVPDGVWFIRIRPSHYYEGRLFARDEQLPSSINAYSAKMAGLLIDTARRLGLVNGEDPEFLLDPKRADALESVVDDIYALQVMQIEPGFGSRRRGDHGTIAAVGEISDATLLVPAKLAQTLATQLGMTTAGKRLRPVSIRTVLQYCLRQNLRCYLQPATALYDELKDEYDRADPSVPFPFKEEIYPADIRDPLLRANRQKQYPRVIALVDVLAAPPIIEKTSSITALPAAYSPALPVGFLIPKGDPLYADRVLRAINSTLYDPERRKWNANFRRLMSAAKVRLFEDGPRHLRFSDDAWVPGTAPEVQKEEGGAFVRRSS